MTPQPSSLYNGGKRGVQPVAASVPAGRWIQYVSPDPRVGRNVRFVASDPRVGRSIHDSMCATAVSAVPWVDRHFAKALLTEQWHTAGTPAGQLLRYHHNNVASPLVGDV